VEWEKVTRPPSPELERFHSDALWFSEHYGELKAQYPDQWVGVYNKKVVGASPDGLEIIDELKAAGFQVGNVYFHFIRAKEQPRILGSSINWFGSQR
jgi:hypothetical protein